MSAPIIRPIDVNTALWQILEMNAFDANHQEL
jgi:hypothetical protein